MSKKASRVSANRSVAFGVAVEILRQLPNHPSRTIARLLHDREPALFPDVERARTLIRALRGNNGDRDRGSAIGGKQFYRPNGKVTDGIDPAFAGLPDAEPESWNVVPVECEKALLLPDVHIPYHDPVALRLALDYGRKQNVDTIVLMGDFVDFYQFSDFERDPRKRDPGGDIEKAKRTLEVIRDSFPAAKIIYLEGNHEERLPRYIWKNAPELAGIRCGEGDEVVTVPHLLDLDFYKITWVGGRRPLRMGPHLHLLHGHEFRVQCKDPANPAKSLFDRTRANAVCAHHHRTSNYTDPGLDRIVSCWSLACLCHLHPHYLPINRWNAGFGSVFMGARDDQWSVENKKIIHGSVV